MEEGDDLAVLMGPFGEPLAFGFSGEGRFPTARLRQWMRSGGRTRLRSRLCAKGRRRFTWSRIDEGDGLAPVPLGRDLRRHFTDIRSESLREDHTFTSMTSA